jgi:ABC-2 type transport system permease protein
VTWPAIRIALRLRVVGTVSTAIGLVVMLIAVGALFPAVGHSIGTLDVPKGVANLLGGADYGTITGWFRGEIGDVYAPFVIAALAIASAAGMTGGEEEDRILALVLAYPVRRSRLVLAKAAAVALIVLAVAFAVWIGLLAGVAAGGGGITVAHITALSIQLAFLGCAVGAVALALGAATGRRGLAGGGAAAVTALGWLVSGFAPLVGAIAWLKYLTLFYYYAGHDPLAHGVGVPGLVVLGLVSLVLTGAAMLAFERRDLRS